MKPDKVVLDTNIWVSYFLKGRSAELVRLVLDHNFLIFSSPILVAELTDVLNRAKIVKYLTLPIEDYLNMHLDLVHLIHTTPLYSEGPDPKDNFLFDLAIQTDSTLIVSGDKKLLEFTDLSPVRIVALSEFKAIFNS